MAMDKKIKTAWVKALRSGKYKQANSVLYNGKGYCCLGVLCRVVGAKVTNDDGDRYFHWGDDHDDCELPVSLQKDLNITVKQQTHLIARNDGIGVPNGTQAFCGHPQSFDQIADYIEAKL